MSRLIIYAPGVNTGGGLVLLRALLSAEMTGVEVFLDKRCQIQVQVPVGAQINWCTPSLIGRIRAEIRLRFLASSEDVVFCFHGLPPLLPSSGRVVVFVQNRLNLKADTVIFGRVALISALKRLLFRTFTTNADEFIVQTQSMRIALQKCLGNMVPVRVLPFLDAVVDYEGGADLPQKNFDFIYVADGVHHKNHKVLCAAWIILAEEGIWPSLVLTLGSRDQKLINEIEEKTRIYNLQIRNVGNVSRERVFSLYRSARALIFPSKVESFGIPLIEATRCDLPIIASELDYVRDVCVPVETFDPDSPVSIARAVKRFLYSTNRSETIMGAEDFLKELLERHSN